MLAGLIAGIVVAAAAATSGLIGSIIDDTNAWHEANDQQEYIDKLYEQQKEQAELEWNKAKEEANKNAEKARQQADLTDLGQDITEVASSVDFNTAIDNLFLSEQSDAWNWNAQSIQAGSAEGASYAALGASGIRAGSSLSEAVNLEAAVNENQLQFAQDTKRRTDNNNLASVLNNLAGVEYGIMGNRIGADIQRQDALDLVNSYIKGGSNYNLYQNQLSQLKEKHDYEHDRLQQEKEKHTGWNAFWNGFMAFNSQGARGFSTGYQIGSQTYQAVNYITGSGGK